MFARLTHIIALTAVVTHLWVSVVVAPWHHLVAHRLPAVETANRTEPNRPAKHCHCRHHAHQTRACDASAGSHEHPAPAAPSHDHDDCPVCQVLAQAFAASEQVTLEPLPERIEFSAPVSAIQPLLGSLIDPASRGPPAA